MLNVQQLHEPITDDVIVAKITNMETGEITTLRANDITFTRTVETESNATLLCKSIDDVSINEIITDTYTVKFEIPSIDESKIRSSASSSKDENYVIATGTVVYQKSGDYITISRCYGSWSTSMQYLYMTDREVWLYNGVPAGEYLEKNPSSNLFNYYTGWGKNLYYPGSEISGPRLFTSAIARVSGMSAYYTIELLVKI